MYNLCMEQRTTIQIERPTLLHLKESRITQRETYNEIINRLLNFWKEDHEKHTPKNQRKDC